jgi:hypothetical protein
MNRAKVYAPKADNQSIQLYFFALLVLSFLSFLSS